MPRIIEAPLPYVSLLARRPLTDVDLVVIHCTELPDLATARAYGERVLYAESGTGNSGHYYVDRDGSVYRYAPNDRTAHHTRGYNPRSIGIELVNRGRWPHWFDTRHQAMDEPYTNEQITSLVGLLQQLQRDVPALSLIAGHEDLDTDEIEATDDANHRVRRKRDPGPRFPWQRVLRESGLDAWPETELLARAGRKESAPVNERSSHSQTPDPLLVRAIDERRRLRFRYHGITRMAEPQCYGRGTRGTELLRVHQLTGGTQPEPLFDVAQMSELELLDEVFEQPGPNYRKNDSAMVEIYRQL